MIEQRLRSHLEDTGFINSAVSGSTRIINRNSIWLQLRFLKSLYVKCYNISLNAEVKATKDLVLFNKLDYFLRFSLFLSFHFFFLSTLRLFPTFS